MSGLRFFPEILAVPLYKGGLNRIEAQKQAGDRPVYKMNSNENPLGPAPEVADAIRKLAARVGDYPPLTDEALRQALADSHGRGLTSDHFFTGNGGFDALEMVARGFIKPGDNAIISSPTFGVYRRIVLMEGGTLRDVPRHAQTFQYDVDAVLAAVTPDTRLVFICNPNNPVGVITDSDDMRALAEGMPEHVLIVADEVYHPFVERDDFPDSISSVQSGKNLVIIQTFSKAHGLAGLRVGYGISTPEIAGYLRRMRRTFHTDVLAYQAALQALQHPEHVDRTVQLVHEGRAYLLTELKRIGLETWPSQSNFIYLRLPMSGDEASSELLRRGIVVRPGSGWDMEDCLRVTVGTMEANRSFVAALEEILEQCVTT